MLSAAGSVRTAEIRESPVLNHLLSIALLTQSPTWAGRPPPEVLARTGPQLEAAHERLEAAARRIDEIEHSVEVLTPMLELCAINLELTHQQPPTAVLALSSKDRLTCIHELSDRILEQFDELEALTDELVELESLHMDVIEVLVRDLIGVVEPERLAPEALGDPPRRLERRNRRAKKRSSRVSRRIHELEYERMTAEAAATRVAADEDRVAAMWASTELLLARRHAELDYLLAAAAGLESIVALFQRRELGMAKLYDAVQKQH